MPGTKKKVEMVDMIVTACRLTAADAAGIEAKFTGATRTYPTRHKEDFMPRLVGECKVNFN